MSVVNKNDFYKQLMTEYTFDAEKIRRSAKRPVIFRNASRFLPLATAAAVFVTVYGGYMLVNRNGADVTPPTTPEVTQGSPLATLSSAERIQENQNNLILQEANRFLAQRQHMFLSFDTPMTPGELALALNAVSDAGNVRILRLYQHDVSYAADDDTIADKTFNGAEVIAPSALRQDLANSPAFIQVEIEGKINADNFIPVTKAEAAQVTTGVSTEPKATETPLNLTTPPTTEAPVTDDAPVSSEKSDAPNISEPQDPNAQPADAPLNEPPTVAPLTEVTYFEVALPYVTDVHFVNDSDFFVLTDNSVQLYRISDSAAERLAYYDAVNPKVTFAGEDKFVILGDDGYGKKTALFIASGDGSLIEADVSAQTRGATILYALISGENALLKVESLSDRAIYSGTISGGTLTFSPTPLKIPSGAVVLSYDGDDFIYSSERVLYRYSNESGLSEVISETYSDDVVFERAKDFRNFAIIDNDAVSIYSADGGDFIYDAGVSAVQFSEYDSDYFTDGANYYRVADTIINAANSAGYSGAGTPVSGSYRVEEVTPDSLRIKRM